MIRALRDNRLLSLALLALALVIGLLVAAYLRLNQETQRLETLRDHSNLATLYQIQTNIQQIDHLVELRGAKNDPLVNLRLHDAYEALWGNLRKILSPDLSPELRPIPGSVVVYEKMRAVLESGEPLIRTLSSPGQASTELTPQEWSKLETWRADMSALGARASTYPLDTEAAQNMQLREARVRLRQAKLQIVLYFLGVILLGAVLLVVLWRQVRRASKSETRLAAAIETMPSGFALFDARGRLTLHNAAYSQLFDTQVHGHPDGDIPAMARDLQDGKAKEVALDDGRWLRLIDRKNDDQSCMLLASDISHAKAREAELETSRQRFERLADASFEGTAVLQDGLIASANARMSELFDYDTQTLIGMDARLLAEPSERQRWQAALEADEASEVKNHKRAVLDLRCVRADGSAFDAELSLRRLADGNNTRVIALRDVSQLKAQQAALHQAIEQAEAGSRAKGEFLATMSHEIRTPMNGVVGMSDMLLETPLNPRQAKYATTLRDSAKSLLVVLNDVLDFSKLDAGEYQLEELSIDLPQLLQSVVDLYEAAAREKGLELRAVVAEGVPTIVRCDPARLRQVLFNLISNAIKFTRDGSVTLQLSAKTLDPLQGPQLKFEVRDTGIGIADENQEELFSPFKQADSRVSREYGGTGLGLAVSKRLVELMGGQIGMVSKLGLGSTFWFCLPAKLGDERELVSPDRYQAPLPAPHLVAAQSPTWQDLSPAQRQDWLDAKRDSRVQRSALDPHGDDEGDHQHEERPAAGHILLVEDSKTNQDVLLAMLSQQPYRIDIADDGEAGVALAEKTDYDLILMDVSMPVMDGLTATQLIRGGDGASAESPIVALTANARVSDRDACLDAGMDDFLTKPIDKALLLDTLTTWLDHRASMAEIDEANQRADAQAATSAPKASTPEAITAEASTTEAITAEPPATPAKQANRKKTASKAKKASSQIDQPAARAGRKAKTTTGKAAANSQAANSQAASSRSAKPQAAKPQAPKTETLDPPSLDPQSLDPQSLDPQSLDPLGHLKLDDAELLSQPMLAQLKTDVGETTARKLIAGFFTELDRHVGDLRTALDDADLPRLRHICHSIKGSAATYGALRLSLSAKAAESAADAEQISEARAAARSTLDLVPDTQQAFAAEL